VTVCEAPPRPAAPACGPAREPGQVATIAAGAARPACRAGVPCQDPFTDADPVREHVRSLMSSRIGWTQVARLAGVPLPTVSYLLYGSPIRGFPPSRRIRTSTADRLLAVTPGSPRAGGALADGTGTRRRLQALVVAGWSERALAETAGLTPEHLRVIVRGRRMVTAATARRVAGLYDKLWDQPPPQFTRAQRTTAARSRGHAARRGWAPAMAWDDGQIDDPSAVPQGIPAGPLTRPELTAAFLEDSYWLIREQGLTPGQAAERLQVTHEALEQAHRRYRSRMLPLLEAFDSLQAEAPDLAPEEAAAQAGSTLATLAEARERLSAGPGQLVAA